MEGDIYKEEGVLVIKAIRVAYQLILEDESKKEEALRAHAVHHPYCPVYKTLEGCVEMTTTLDFVSS